jgi:hypothetical protein
MTENVVLRHKQNNAIVLRHCQNVASEEGTLWRNRPSTKELGSEINVNEFLFENVFSLIFLKWTSLYKKNLSSLIFVLFIIWIIVNCNGVTSHWMCPIAFNIRKNSLISSSLLRKIPPGAYTIRANHFYIISASCLLWTSSVLGRKRLSAENRNGDIAADRAGIFRYIIVTVVPARYESLTSYIIGLAVTLFSKFFYWVHGLR